MRRSPILSALVIVFAIFGVAVEAQAQVSTGEAVLKSLSMVWDDGPHNAFTDLMRFQDTWYVTFREAVSHAVPSPGTLGGNIRILSSEDGVTWSPFAFFEAGANEDLRDPVLTITPGGTLLLSSAYAPLTAPTERQSVSWIYDGTTWSERYDIGDYDQWLWGFDTQGDNIYSISYGPISGGSSQWHTRLYRGTDGTDFQTLVPMLNTEPGTTEGALLFREDGTAAALIRDDSGSRYGLVGTATGDYTSWTWKSTGVQIGGPELVELPDGRLVAGTRLYDGGARTSLSFVDPAAGTLTEFLSLPSGGDTSYPGLVWHEDRLWMSYYSSHEGKSKIYIAQIEFTDPNAPWAPIRHVGDTDPLEEGWLPFNAGSEIASNDPVDDGGVPAWFVNDDTTKGRAAWTQPLGGPQIEQALAHGWRMEGTLRVANQQDALDGAIELSAYLNSQEGYVLWFGSDSNSNTVVGELVGAGSTGVHLGRTATVPGLDYHDFEMLYDPLSETVDVFADGVEILSDYEGLLQDTLSPLNRVLWGANASGGVGAAYYSFVEFTVFVEGDANRDGSVSSADLDVVRANWGASVTPGDVSSGDLSGDGTVGSADLDIIRANWGRGAGSSAAVVPEPLVGILLFGVVLPVFVSRKRGPGR